jgi:hypothetical protein
LIGALGADNISGDVKILRQSIGNGHMDGFFGKSESNAFFHAAFPSKESFFLLICRKRLELQ